MTCSCKSNVPGPRASARRIIRLLALSVMPFNRSASFTASVDSPGLFFMTDMMREVRSCVLEYRESFTLKDTVLLIALSFLFVSVFVCTMSQLVQCSVPGAPIELENLAAMGN